MPECSGILKEMSSAELRNQGKNMQETRKQVRKKWKKLIGKENLGAGNEDNQATEVNKIQRKRQ